MPNLKIMPFLRKVRNTNILLYEFQEGFVKNFGKFCRFLYARKAQGYKPCQNRVRDFKFCFAKFALRAIFSPASF